MALSREAVQEAVFGAVADVNESLPADRRVPLMGTTDVFSALDSLAALNLLLRIEQRVGDLLDAPFDLTEGEFYERTLFGRPTLDELARAVYEALTEAAA